MHHFPVWKRLVPAAPVCLPQNFFNSENTSGFVKDYLRLKMTRMARGERDSGSRGGEGFMGRGIRGSNDDRWDPVDMERDPYRDLRDGFEEMPGPLNDEYIWPSTEEEEED
jgi:hypothetical protein